MSTLGKAVIEFSADTARFYGDIGRAAARFESAMASMSSGLASLRNMAIATAGPAAMLALAKSAIDVGDQLYKVSQVTGRSMEGLSSLRLAWQLGAVQLDGFGKGLKDFNQSLVEAQDKTSKAGMLFKALGVDITAGPEKAFRQFAEGVSKLPTEALRTAAAIEIMKKTGAEWVPVLSAGAKGLDEAADKTRKLGLVMSDDFGKQANKFNEHYDTLKKSVGSFGIAMTKDAIKPLAEMTGNMASGAERVGKFWAVAIEGAKLFHATLGRVVPLWDKFVGERAFKGLDDMLKGRLGPEVSGKIGGLGPQRNQLAEVNAEHAACVLSGGKWLGGKCVRGEAKADPFQQQLERLRKEAAGIGGSDKASDQLRVMLAEDPALRALSQAKKDLLMNEAAIVDQKRLGLFVTQKQIEAQERATELGAEAAAHASEYDLAQMDAAEAIRRQLDPMIELNEKIRQIAQLVKGGFLSPEFGEQAFERLMTDFTLAQAKANNLGQEITKTDKAFESMWAAISSRTEEAIVDFKNFGDVLRALEQDLLRIGTRLLVTEPLGEWFKGVVKPSGGGNIFDSIANWFTGGGGAAGAGAAMSSGEFGASALIGLAGFAEGTDYVPATGPYVLHKGEAVIPAGENMGGGVTIIQNISTPDVAGFRAAQGQLMSDAYAAAALAAERNS